MDQETLLIEIYCKVSDLLKQDKFVSILSRPGAKPKLSDSELITLSIFQEFSGIHKEDDYWKYCNNRLIQDFPTLCDKSQYNRRIKKLRNVINLLRIELLKELPVDFSAIIFDTLPVPVATYTKGSKTRQFEEADFGYCSSKKLKYFGYKTAISVTKNGIPIDFEIGPASPNDIEYAKSMLGEYKSKRVIADKALSGYKFKDSMLSDHTVLVITPDKSNAKRKSPQWHRALIRIVRNRVETVIGQLANLFGFERTWAKSQIGTFTRLINKLTAYVFSLFINRKYDLAFNKIDHLTGLI